MWIDFSFPSSSTSTRSRPFSIILQTDRQTDGWMVKGQAARASHHAAGPEATPLDEAKVAQHCPHRLVVMRLPLTKVVEVETERKPSPASAPELKDEAKKSAEGNNRVSARVGAWESRGQTLCKGTRCPGTPPPGKGWQHLLPEDPGKGEKKWPPPWCREPGPRSSEKGSISSGRHGLPISIGPAAWQARSKALPWASCQGQPCTPSPSLVAALGLETCPRTCPHPPRTKEVSEGVSPAKELSEDVMSAAEGESEFGGPGIGPGARWSCHTEEAQS